MKFHYLAFWIAAKPLHQTPNLVFFLIFTASFPFSSCKTWKAILMDFQQKSSHEHTQACLVRELLAACWFFSLQLHMAWKLLQQQRAVTGICIGVNTSPSSVCTDWIEEIPYLDAWAVPQVEYQCSLWPNGLPPAGKPNTPGSGYWTVATPTQLFFCAKLRLVFVL